MPLYDFKCPHCGHETEELVPATQLLLECSKCAESDYRAVMERQFPAPATHVKLSPEELTARLRKRSLDHGRKHIDRVAVERKIFGVEDN